MKTYLVTGGAGFIGSNFVYYLLNKYDCLLYTSLLSSAAAVLLSPTNQFDNESTDVSSKDA